MAKLRGIGNNYLGRHRGAGGAHRAKPYAGKHRAETNPLGLSVSGITSRLFKERVGTKRYKSSLKGLFF